MLRTNGPALRFYRRLAAPGLDEIEVMRLDWTGTRGAPSPPGHESGVTRSAAGRGRSGR